MQNIAASPLTGGLPFSYKHNTRAFGWLPLIASSAMSIKNIASDSNYFKGGASMGGLVEVV
jgi:hypothetical protein